MNMTELTEKMREIQKQIIRWQYQTNYRNGEFVGLDLDVDNPNEMQRFADYLEIMGNLEELSSTIVCLELPIRETDTIYRRTDGKYGNKDGSICYKDGDYIEFLTKVMIGSNDGEIKEVPIWVESTVKTRGKKMLINDYEDLSMEGLRVRVRDLPKKIVRLTLYDVD